MHPQSIKYLRLLGRLHRAKVSAEETKTSPAAAWLCSFTSAGRNVIIRKTKCHRVTFTGSSK